MPPTHEQTANGMRDKRAEGSDQADELKQAFRSLNGPPSSQTPANLPFGGMLERIASYWWIELVLGILWIVVAVVVLKFNHASVTTVGILIGLMFLVFAAEDFLLAYVDRDRRWLWGIFGVLLAVGGIVGLIEPEQTFKGFADILGFVFLLIAVQWMVQAFAERAINSLWWMTLISGILMVGIAFWISGQFFMTRAYTLLIFAGIWAMANGIIAIIRAFEIREVGQRLRRPFPG